MAVVAFLLPLTSLRAGTAVPPVRILDTHGSSSESNWTVVNGLARVDPRHLVLDNGRIRITYPAASSGENAGHVLYVNIGGVYKLAGDAEMGDWTYAGSGFTDSLTSFAIIENTSEVAQIRLTFASHRHEYQNNTSLPVQKTIVLHRGVWGYRAMLQMTSNLPGEREVGFGGTKTHLFCYSNKKGILWNASKPPSAATGDGTDDVFLREDGQSAGDWWAASLAFNRSYYRLVSLRPGNLAGLRTGQYTGGNTGHLIHWGFEGLSSYEAFIAAVPYDGTMATRVTVTGGKATVNAPRAGTYSLYTRAIVGRRHTYLPAKRGIVLRAGTNTVNVAGVRLVAPILVPVSDGANLPEDISRKYRNGDFD